MMMLLLLLMMMLLLLMMMMDDDDDDDDDDDGSDIDIHESKMHNDDDALMGQTLTSMNRIKTNA